LEALRKEDEKTKNLQDKIQEQLDDITEEREGIHKEIHEI
jgi:flagellar motility protein MotE (MotC chaperone)